MTTVLAIWQYVNAVLEKITRVQGKRAGKDTSEGTASLTKAVVYAAFRLLHRLGYKIQHPKNLTSRHIEVLVRHWHHVQHKAPKSMENQLSRLRIFCKFAGKPHLVKRVKDYLPEVDPKTLVVTSIAQESKAWSAKGLDMPSIFERVDRHDWRLGLMLRMELAFGLRREEVIKCRPWIQDRGLYLDVLEGQGKGGRPRTVPITTSAQREVLDFVKARIKKGEYLGWPETRRGQPATLKQNIKRYSNEMARLGLTKAEKGITGHGLRSQFAENAALLLGILPPTLGGKKPRLDKDDMNVVTGQLSESMGHSRRRAMGAYYGSFANVREAGITDDFVTRLNEVLAILGSDLPAVPSERRADCQAIVCGLLDEINYSNLNLRQAHALWSYWARRQGVDWVSPRGEVTKPIESVVNAILAAHRPPSSA